jgi:hypothetical protein
MIILTVISVCSVPKAIAGSSGCQNSNRTSYHVFESSYCACCIAMSKGKQRREFLSTLILSGSLRTRYARAMAGSRARYTLQYV